MNLWKDGRFVEDDMVLVADEEALPEGGVFVSPARYAAQKAVLAERNAPVGIVLQPSDRIEAVAADLKNLPVLAIAFPKFSDGRGFSLARLARERYGFAGELRAVGDILYDRVAYMLRCGFDTLAITNGPTITALAAGHVPVSHQHYQPTGADGADRDPLRPWRRRA